MIVDFCAYVGEWPTYELRYRDAGGLLRLMDRCGIDAACVSLAGGMFYYDARQANERLIAEIGAHRDRLWPVGTLDLTVPTWREDLEEGLEGLGLLGVRLHPAYHGYSLSGPQVLELADRLAEVRRPLFLALYVDEERLQHAAIRVPELDVAEIAALIRDAPRTTIVLNSFRVPQARQLFAAGVDLGHVYLDANALDQNFEGLSSLVRDYGVERLLFGSQIPFLYPEAARLVVEHSGLSPQDIQAILEGNWQSSPTLAEMHNT